MKLMRALSGFSSQRDRVRPTARSSSRPISLTRSIALAASCSRWLLLDTRHNGLTVPLPAVQQGPQGHTAMDQCRPHVAVRPVKVAQVSGGQALTFPVSRRRAGSSTGSTSAARCPVNFCMARRRRGCGPAGITADAVPEYFHEYLAPFRRARCYRAADGRPVGWAASWASSFLPIAALPNVSYPTCRSGTAARLRPADHASSLATPLERSSADPRPRPDYLPRARSLRADHAVRVIWILGPDGCVSDTLSAIKAAYRLSAAYMP